MERNESLSDLETKLNDLDSIEDWKELIREAYAILEEMKPGFVAQSGIKLDPDIALNFLGERYRHDDVPYIIGELCTNLKKLAHEIFSNLESQDSDLYNIHLTNLLKDIWSILEGRFCIPKSDSRTPSISAELRLAMAERAGLSPDQLH